MKYNIGDKIELKNGSIVIITDIVKGVSGDYCYISHTVPISEENIVCKVKS